MMPELDISIAGEINLDLILYGLPASIPMERELLATDFKVTLGSSSAILAHNLATLGAKVGFITRIGSDELGVIAIDRLAASGVDLSKVVRSKGPTATGVTVLLPHENTRHILTYPGTMAEMTRADLDFDYLARARHFHLSSLFLQRGLHPDLPQLFRDLKRVGLTLSLDTNDDPDDQWNGVLSELLDLIDILLPNEAEACRIAHRDTLDEALAWLSRHVPIVAVKRGSYGTLIQRGAERIVVDPVTVQPVDTIGAGDSFNAGFLSAWLSGCDLQSCGIAGNIAGSLSTLCPGGTEAFRDPALWKPFLKEHGFPGLA
jgi:sugar/nucleoside kinase (ribokinase family)